MTTLSLLEVRDAIAEEKRRILGVVELCAGVPMWAPDFIGAGTSLTDVRRALAQGLPQQGSRPASKPAAGQAELFRPMGRHSPLAGSGFDLALIEAAIAERRNASVQ